ncbi:NAD(P)-binding protein [Clathrospora elynae]|uniref:NAD(P)-binding protein n=1 Tax=Clathrospora elynae TaxID=706981 RepID=A0A6A5S8Q8_9PLEO|nr:NAD(P)-binding protein [Clathrospora elynae]
MTSNNVLVFGPTGAVGCAAAIEAHRRGASVWLAMRDPKKEIKGLKEEGELYNRVPADLSKPDTLKHAVQQSSATSAFVYTIFDSADNMRSSFAALKEAGITHIVLLSSASVSDPLGQEANMKSMISKVHTSTEVALQESGIPYTAVRPAYFNSNLLWVLDQIKMGAVGVLYPNVKYDYIAPSDIGTVCGALLSEPRFQKEAGPSFYLYGPELISQRDAWGVIGKALGREITVKEIDEETYHESLAHMPRPVVDAIVNVLKKSNEGHTFYREPYEEVVNNIRKYAEREPMGLGEWVKANKAAFS